MVLSYASVSSSSRVTGSWCRSPSGESLKLHSIHCLLKQSVVIILQLCAPTDLYQHHVLADVVLLMMFVELLDACLVRDIQGALVVIHAARGLGEVCVDLRGRGVKIG